MLLLIFIKKKLYCNQTSDRDKGIGKAIAYFYHLLGPLKKKYKLIILLGGL